jgi:hypothetical protein
MVGTVDLCVAVHTAFVQGEGIESGHVHMDIDNIDVTLLAQLVAAPGQQTGVVGTVRRMACEAALLHRGMLPQRRPAILRVALITGVIDCACLEHFAALPAMRIVAGGTIHFHDFLLGAEKMGGALVEGLADIGVTAETGVLGSATGQHPLG